MFEIIMVVLWACTTGWLVLHDKKEQNEHHEILAAVKANACKCEGCK